MWFLHVKSVSCQPAKQSHLLTSKQYPDNKSKLYQRTFYWPAPITHTSSFRLTIELSTAGQSYWLRVEGESVWSEHKHGEVVMVKFKAGTKVFACDVKVYDRGGKKGNRPTATLTHTPHTPV